MLVYCTNEAVRKCAYLITELQLPSMRWCGHRICNTGQPSHLYYEKGAQGAPVRKPVKHWLTRFTHPRKVCAAPVTCPKAVGGSPIEDSHETSSLPFNLKDNDEGGLLICATHTIPCRSGT